MRRIGFPRLVSAHERFVEAHRGEFLNHGWCAGGVDDGRELFIHSKTSVGRLYSCTNKNRTGVEHWWTPGGGHGFSADLSDSVRARLPKKVKRKSR